MKPLVKGGVWKNSEDEILKSGIMKYGKNQWARVATLLPRKTARQCKRRWYEWLDPMIKKTDWTREEDEKLLHLAKLMPSQWRTIAPMVGRTADQCLERYSQLLDSAAGESSTSTGEHGFDVQLGEIDPNPESKPARPDPVDMDEDEKEMLSEAKARLANTKGKKAKRQAREKLLESAKRVAKLQKYREMKAAGIGGKMPKHLLEGRNRKDNAGIDYFSGEIAFERQVPQGFHDTSQEELDGNVLKLAQKSKAKLMKMASSDPDRKAQADRESMKRDRERFEKLAKQNLTAALQEIDQRNNDVDNGIKRAKLALPEPIVSDMELEEIGKMKEKQRATGHITDDLIAESQRDSAPQPSQSVIMRTPLAPDVVLEEAKNHRLRLSASTPLVGGPRVEITAEGTGFQGSAPSVRSVTTPSILHKSNVSVSTNASMQSTRLRDSLNINRTESEDGDFASEAIVSRAEAREMKRAKVAKLQFGLSSLPQPKYSYDIQVPIHVAEEEEDSVVADASDELAAKKRAKAKLVAQQLQKRTEVTKRGLPIPTSVPTFEKTSDTVQSLINSEIATLLEQDVLGKEASRVETYRSRANKMIADEMITVKRDDDSMLEALYAQLKPLMKRDAKKETAMLHACIKETQASLEKTNEALHNSIQEFQQRADVAREAFQKVQEEIERDSRNLVVFQHMLQVESAGIPERVHAMEDRLNNVVVLENKLQHEYYKRNIESN